MSTTACSRYCMPTTHSAVCLNYCAYCYRRMLRDLYRAVVAAVPDRPNHLSAQESMAQPELCESMDLLSVPAGSAGVVPNCFRAKICQISRVFCRLRLSAQENKAETELCESIAVPRRIAEFYRSAMRRCFRKAKNPSHPIVSFLKRSSVLSESQQSFCASRTVSK